MKMARRLTLGDKKGNSEEEKEALGFFPQDGSLNLISFHELNEKNELLSEN